MRTPVISAAALVAVCIAASAAPLTARQGVERPREGGFELFLTQDYGDDAGGVLAAGVAIPYRSLVFFLRDGRYEARYRVYLELADERGKRVRGDVWEESVGAADFRETTSSASLARSSRRFAVAPGAYRAVATIEVVGTSRRFVREETARIVGGEGGRLELGNPSFYEIDADSQAPGPEAAARFSRCSRDSASAAGEVQSSIFGKAGSSARVRYSLYVPAGGAGRRVVFSTRVRGASGTVVRYHRAVLEDVEPGPEVLCLDLDIDDWRIGYYTIESVVESPEARLRTETDGRFLVLFNGGLLGVGVGSGKQKLFYLPEMHTDYIFSVIGEELGFAGVVLVGACYITVVWVGFRIARRARDPFGKYLAMAFSSVIGIQALMNMMVGLKMLPPKGMVLPFLSYGGSSLILHLAAIGVLMNVSRKGADGIVAENDHRRGRDRRARFPGDRPC
ncbi:MAG: hypothetical protein C4574_01885 [Candidatus Latescibacterota bacterium]|nr:MAG: hypothetical protein C4574_01885 [Candidatus Latescibacterota bacterium]